MFPDPLRDIADQVGLRVITYLHRDVAAVAGVLADQFTVLDDRDLGKETASQGRFGYASRHLQIALPDGDVSKPVHLEGAQVQVRTVLQHAWAEFEHATRYKGTIPAADVSELDRRFTLAAGLLEMADSEFSAIHERLRATGSDRRVGLAGDTPRVDAEDLAIFLTERYAEAGWSRPDHYAWMSGLLLELRRSPPSTSSPRCSRPWTPRRSPSGWATATRPVPCAASTTPSSTSTAPATSPCPATSAGSTRSSPVSPSSVPRTRRAD